MTRTGVTGVGFCARMTPVGDWAFDFALDLARHHETQLDIFFFPSLPCEPHPSRGRKGELLVMPEGERISLEKDVRFYYDEKLGDYESAGFRLCDGNEEPELRRCLVGREYSILVLAFQGSDCSFGRYNIVDFAEHMPCPVVLVGPSERDEVYFNGPAEAHTDLIPVGSGSWKSLKDAREAPLM